MPSFSISTAASGDTTILAVDATNLARPRKIVGLAVKAAGSTTVQFVAIPTTGAEILLTGAIPLSASDSGYSLNLSPSGRWWWYLGPTYRLVLRNGSAVSVTGTAVFDY